MNTLPADQYLFPKRWTRRDFLKIAGTAAASLALPGATAQAAAEAPIRIGSGHWTYELVPGWGQLPGPLKYGWGCGIVVDSKDNVYVHTRSNPSVAIFNRGGRFLNAWGEDFAQASGTTGEKFTKTAHCVYWSKEGKNEFLYFTDHPRGLVFKTDLTGKILLTIGNVNEESDTSFKVKFDNPTDVAVAANGDIYVCEGYGSQLVHRFNSRGLRLKTIGGRGREDGLFNTCHGIWISTLNREPEVYVADRHNDRLQVFDLELTHKRTLKGNVRNPCCFYQHKKHLYIPDLAGRVTIMDAKDKLTAHLGDGTETKKELRDKNPALFSAPHAMCVDSRGDIYVVEWLDYGRVRKFKHTPQHA